ncbi:MAG: hypothetical protein H0W90_07975 [Actinobacteria bacterium]|nr:hypothetical protein [Actinomycetota bacterium]
MDRVDALKRVRHGLLEGHSPTVLPRRSEAIGLEVPAEARQRFLVKGEANRFHYGFRSFAERIGSAQHDGCFLMMELRRGHGGSR